MKTHNSIKFRFGRLASMSMIAGAILLSVNLSSCRKEMNKWKDIIHNGGNGGGGSDSTGNGGGGNGNDSTWNGGGGTDSTWNGGGGGNGGGGNDTFWNGGGNDSFIMKFRLTPSDKKLN